MATYTPARRVVVITGASAGIGAELARQLAALPGYSLVLAARREAELTAVTAECEERGSKSLAVVADVTKKEQVELVLRSALEEFGDCHVWVNNAGAGCVCSTLQLDAELVDSTIAVNLKSALWGMQVSAAHFSSRPGGGHVLNVSSFLGRCPAASVRSIYSAAKAALNSLASNARMDLALAGHGNVRISTVMPGVVTTSFGAVAATRVSASAPPRIGPPPPPPAGFYSQTAAECAAVILGAVQSSASGTGEENMSIPVELFTQGEAQRMAALTYVSDVAAWEAASVAALRKPAAA